MLRGIARIVGHRAAGWSCAAAMAGLAAAFALTTVQARRDTDFLQGRIAALATHDASQVQAELANCQAAVRADGVARSASAPRPDARPHTLRVKALGGDAVAARLLSNPPAGFDGCARMESADQAVMKALIRR
jgi:hypothetical protein